MRELLTFACRAFPPDHRARRSDEVVDTALLVADGSGWRAAREALSLVVAGVRQRLRAESGRSLQEGVALLAGILALLNLAVALAGIAADVYPPPPTFNFLLPLLLTHGPYVVDWWWIAFAVAAAGIVVGLVLGNRRLALGAALANLGLVAYDATLLAGDGHGHMTVFTYLQGMSFPGGWQWLSAAVVLALAIAVAPLRRLPLRRLPLALAAAVLLIVLSREAYSGFFFLAWPLAAIVVLAMAFGALVPRLAVIAVGLTLVVVPTIAAYLTEPYYHAQVVTWVVAAGLAVGVVVPLAQLTRRRLT
jgi:hypothetical protein